MFDQESDLCLPDHLLKGYRSFVQRRYSSERDFFRKQAQENQFPSTMVIACCDSRVAPELIFNAPPGELFVVRNIANLVPPYIPDGQYHGTSAALEYAVLNLGVEHIIVMGHALCGGVQAVLNPEANSLLAGEFTGKWMSFLEKEARMIVKNSAVTPGEREKTLERMSIRLSLANLRSFPFVLSCEKSGCLSLYGAWFDILTGDLWVLNPVTGHFEKTSIS